MLQEKKPVENNVPIPVSTSTNATSTETMVLTVYLQDKEVARVSDCRVTKKATFEIPKTTGVADASLKYLFGEELKKFGVYKSVSIENGVAKVLLADEIGSLSSCESGHIMGVLTDTLTQYPTIQKVELYGPLGKIEF
ncbi:MAG: hypothetical protein V4686_00530 [Patescibacteria group bacterium]